MVGTSGPAVHQPEPAENTGSRRTEVITLTVTESAAGQRLDNFLLRHLKGAPRSLIYRIIRRGEVRVNSRRTRAHARLEAADRVRVPPLRLAATKPAPHISKATRTAATSPLYEDEHLLILDKPAGLAVHGGTGVDGGLVEELRVIFPDQGFLELVHRIDRDTSGCLLLAKDRQSLTQLHELFRAHDSRRLEKKYQVLVADLRGASKEMGRSLRVRDDLVDERGRRQEADTEFSQRARYTIDDTDEKTTLIYADVRLHSGRKHQIRRHAAARQLPVAGDGRYGHFALNRRLRRAGLRRLFLHANEIRFKHPVRQTMIQVQAPLPNELKACLDGLTST